MSEVAVFRMELSACKSQQRLCKVGQGHLLEHLLRKNKARRVQVPKHDIITKVISEDSSHHQSPE